MVLKVVTGGNFNGPIYYQGTWDANANNPFLQSGVGFTGEYYIVSVAGNTNLDGISNWQVGDWAIFNSATNKWEKIDGGSYGTTLNIVNDSTSNTAYNLALTNSSGGLVDTEYVDNGKLTFNPSTQTLTSGRFVAIEGSTTANGPSIEVTTIPVYTYPSIGFKAQAFQITAYDTPDPDNNVYNYSVFGDYGWMGLALSTTNNIYDLGNICFAVNQFGAINLGKVTGGANAYTNSGTFGQILTSGGDNAAAYWSTPANGTVVSITSGTGITATPNPITSSGTIAITNTSVSAGSYGNSTTVATFTVNAQGQLTQAANVTISVPSSQVTGLGTMATQNANAVAITGGSINVTTTNHTANVTANATFATSSLPLVPAGYIVYDLNGTLVKIPYYAV